MYSTLYSKHVKLIHENEMIKSLVFDTFDKAVDRQLQQFTDLFHNTLASTFSNPWVFLKRASAGIDEDAKLDEAVDKVQMLVLRTYACIRAQISDQIELFAESF